MMLLLLDQNKDRTRKTAAFDAPPQDPSILYIFDHARDWIEVCEDSGIFMQQFATQGYADQQLVKACIDELGMALKWPYYLDLLEALEQSVGTVTVEAE